MSAYANLAVVILAAGKGTRMKSDKAKVLHQVAGRSMVVHVVECAKKVAGDNVHVVVGHQAQEVKEEVRQNFTAHFSIQEQLLGTGDAVKSALPDLDSNTTDLLVLCGDVPLIQEETLIRLINGHRKSKAKVTVLATNVENPTGYGRLILDDEGDLVCIREETDASAQEKTITTINTGIYCFNKKVLSSVIHEIKPDNKQEEYYLTDVIAIAKKKHLKISVVTMTDPKQVIGVNTLEELGIADDLYQALNR